MREIKFRAWFVETGHEKNEPCMVNDYNSKIYMEFMGINPRIKGYEVDVMQFTGLQDVTGKDIYEGDILKITDYPYLPASQDKDKNSPFYKKEKVIYEAPSFNLGGWLNFDSDCIYEIIGNIYENPELL